MTEKEIKKTMNKIIELREERKNVLEKLRGLDSEVKSLEKLVPRSEIAKLDMVVNPNLKV
ncbi:hypothetical protein [Aquimarina algiphila]|uniref:hypothetical protein n=1 Tax=Aquimarina algiphila TaxID=2047982 RepID=UPI00232DCB67|nr:hypothetical protein [Aquimarina algiphila]